MKKFLAPFTNKNKPSRSEMWLVIFLMLIAGIAHAWNMFHFPYFENDEATYVSQAWSFIHGVQLSPYIYYYDHAPLGWIFLGLWFFVTCGLTTFGHIPLFPGIFFFFILPIFSVS